MIPFSDNIQALQRFLSHPQWDCIDSEKKSNIRNIIPKMRQNLASDLQEEAMKGKAWE